MTYTVEIPEGGDPKVLEAFLKALGYPFTKSDTKSVVKKGPKASPQKKDD